MPNRIIASLAKMVPAKFRPWILSLLGGSVLVLAWFFLDQAERQRLADMLKSSVRAPGSGIAVTNGQIQPPSPAPPTYPGRGEREDREDDEWEVEDDGEYRPTPPTNAAPPPTQPQLQPAPSPSPAAGVIYGDGVYRATSQAPWGPMTIEVTVSGGKWTGITNVDVPNSPPSYRAAPLLVQQALQAQSAQIDGVSGATYTSDAFRDDLKQIVQLSKK